MNARFVTAVAAMTMAAAPALAQRLYAADSDQDLLFSIDPATGAGTIIGSTAPAGTPAGLAWNSNDSRMYTIDLAGGEVYTVDLASGSLTSIGNSGLSGWQGIASDPTDRGQLYASNQNGNLYQIDSAGASTLVGSVGPLVTALEFDSRGQLWGIEFFTGEIRMIDKTNGSSTITAIAPVINFQGLAFDDNGVAYAANTTDDSLYTIDLTTGATTIIGPNSTLFAKGLAFELSGTTCYPDCTGEGTLDIFDFLCFQDAFVQMAGYADCDGNTVYDIFDFLCFQDAFVTGCP